MLLYGKNKIIKAMNIIWHITEIYQKMKEIKEESFDFEEFAYSGSSRT